MKRTCLLLAAVCSACGAARAAARPHFGGTLRIEMRGSLSSYDKPAANANDEVLRDAMLTSVCDRLVTLDDAGTPRPALAMAWRSEREGRSWYFTLRPAVTLHNGGGLTQQMTIASLAAANPGWRVRSEGGEVMIQSDNRVRDLLYELAEPRNSICYTGENGQWIGSGPFQIAEFQPGQRIELKAFDDAWAGRPFLDRIRIEMGKPLAEQAVDLQLGRADVTEIDSSQAGTPNADVLMTEPTEMLALAFAPGRQTTADIRLREAVSRAIDRNSIFSVLLRRQGESSAALLPEWISGYAHLFDTEHNGTTAQALAKQVGLKSSLSLGYESNDPQAKLIAERVAVNAREAGIIFQPVAMTGDRSGNLDASLVRLRIASPNSTAALAALSSELRLPILEKVESASTAEALYELESQALKDYSVIPIVHVPESFAAAPVVHDWKMSRWGEIDWGSLWMEAAK